MNTASSADSITYFKYGPVDDTRYTTSSGGNFDYYDPQPVEIQVKTPKKPRVLQLERARQKEQLKAWGLRKR